MSKEPQYSNAFNAALELIGQEPLPANAKKQLEALEAQCTKEEKVLFGDLWSTFMLSTGPVPEA